MPSSTIALVVLALAGGDGDPPPVRWAQITIEQRIIVRVPMRRDPPPDIPARIEWEEHKGPKCVPLDRIRGAMLTRRDGVDLVVARMGRVRAKLGRGCRSEDFYSGFYLEPTRDGAVCAGRDDLHARSGATCEITGFKRLVPDDD